MIAFEDFKEYLVAASGLSKDALHIQIGLLLYFALHAILRRTLGSFAPAVIVLLVTLAGEALDIIHLMERERETVELVDNLWDIWNTMFWPVLFTIYGRWGPGRA